MKKVVVAVIMICSMFVVGCTVQMEGKQNIPEVAYEKVGQAVQGKIGEDGTVVVTYALLGVKENVIKYLYLDQIETNPQEDRHLFTNKELGSAYGLSYKSSRGEWNQQVQALESYIKGNNMKLDDVNNIPVYQKDAEHLMVPEEGTGLGTVCELDISDFLAVINEAYNNMQETTALRIGVGEKIHVSKKNNTLDIQFAFVGTDYRYKVCYSELESYSIHADVKADEVEANDKGKLGDKGIVAFEQYMLGLNMLEVIGVETYDPGNGIDTKLPKKGTDLAEVCEIDLSNILSAIEEAGSRF